MSKDVWVELDDAGMQAFLKGPEVQSVLVSYASQVKDRAGDGYDIHIGRYRANVSVVTATEGSEQDNLDNNTLLKAVRG